MSMTLYAAAFLLLIVSALKDRGKTKMALKKALKSFLNLLPQMTSIMLFVGISLAILDQKTISQLIGAESGLTGIAIATVIGSVTLIPGFVAFPLAAALLKGGAGYAQTAAFVSTLMAVGVVTISAEIKYLNKSIAILRNSMALLITLIFSFIIGKVM